MADVFSNSLRLREQESGSNAGTWGSLLNSTIRNIASAFGQGSETIPNASTHTITLADGVADEARSMYLKCTGGGQACTVTLAPNTISKVWIISNETSFTLTFTQGSGANVAVAAGAVKMIVTDGAGSGAAVVDALSGLSANVSDLTTTGDISFGDNDKAIFGAGSDLALYHDGSNSYIKDQGTGDLYIQGEANVRITDGDGNKMFLGQNDGEVQLYYNGAEKLNTTSTGIDVTGGVTTNANSYLNGLRVGGADTGNTIYQPTGDLSISSASGTIFLKPSGTSVLTATSTGIGIGAGSPSQPLHVDATGGTTAALFDNNGTNGDVVRVAKNGTDVLKIRAEGTADLALDANGGAFIFKAGGTEAMRISGANVLVGTTTTTAGNEGLVYFNGSSLRVTRDSDEPLNLDRLTSDGTIAAFKKDGTTVGSIGSQSGTHINIDSGGNRSGLRFEDNGLLPRKNSAMADGTVSLGNSSYRFSDLYLSGIANIGTYLRFGGASNYYVHSDNANYLRFGEAGAERMRISDGNLLVGTTTTGSGAQSGVAIAGGASSSDIYIRHANGTSSGAVYASFIYNTSEIGKISQNGTSQVLYQISSDQRLKSNIANAAEDAGELIDAIQVRQFDWIADGEHQRYGMIAQELQTVAPEAVGGDPDSDEMMGVDYSKLVPMLVKEIQSLRNRVAQLES